MSIFVYVCLYFHLYFCICFCDADRQCLGRFVYFVSQAVKRPYISWSTYITFFYQIFFPLTSHLVADDDVDDGDDDDDDVDNGDDDNDDDDEEEEEEQISQDMSETPKLIYIIDFRID